MRCLGFRKFEFMIYFRDFGFKDYEWSIYIPSLLCIFSIEDFGFSVLFEEFHFEVNERVLVNIIQNH